MLTKDLATILQREMENDPAVADTQVLWSNAHHQKFEVRRVDGKPSYVMLGALPKLPKAPKDSRLKRAVLELVLDALWEYPMFIRDKDTTRLSEEDVKEWTGKVDALFHRAETHTWKPEEK